MVASTFIDDNEQQVVDDIRLLEVADELMVLSEGTDRSSSSWFGG